MAEQTINWTGESGKEYKYWISDIGVTMKAEPGNYIFACRSARGRFAPIYIGETSDLNDRLSNPDGHHRIACIRKEGATHICTHTSSTEESVRRAEESDLVNKWHPPCND